MSNYIGFICNRKISTILNKFWFLSRDQVLNWTPTEIIHCHYYSLGWPHNKLDLHSDRQHSGDPVQANAAYKTNKKVSSFRWWQKPCILCVLRALFISYRVQKSFLIWRQYSPHKNRGVHAYPPSARDETKPTEEHVGWRRMLTYAGHFQYALSGIRSEIFKIDNAIKHR